MTAKTNKGFFKKGNKYRPKVHGQLKHGMYKTRQYRIWRGMVNRCRYPNEINYSRYGAKGITVCAEWERDFVRFWEDMKDDYTNQMTIDRIDNNKGYSKENCRWVSAVEQGRNKSSVRLFRHKGQLLTTPQIAEMYRMSYWSLRDRLKRGMKLEEAVAIVKQPIKNVSYDKARNKWRAYTNQVNGRRKELGRFDTEEEALQAVKNEYEK